MIPKIQELFQSVWGVFLVVIGYVANFFGGYVMAITAVVTCVVVDLIWGILSARKQHKYAQSELIHFEWFPTGVVASVICATELWSISGNILIVNPNIPFFNIIRPALKGEIARKLNIPEDDVDDALNGLINKK